MFIRPTDSHRAWPVAPDLLDQDFTAAGPGEQLGVNISCIWTGEGWLYFAFVTDLSAYRIIGCSTSDRLHHDLALAALRMAAVMRLPAAGLIHNPDRSSQCCSMDYQAELKANGTLISMSGWGSCLDGGLIETFFNTLKSNPSGASP